MRYGLPEDFLSKWQIKRRTDGQTDRRTDGHADRLPLVVLSAAVAAKKSVSGL